MHYAATGSLVYFGPNFGLSRMQNTRGQYCTDLLPFCLRGCQCKVARCLRPKALSFIALWRRTNRVAVLLVLRFGLRPPASRWHASRSARTPRTRSQRAVCGPRSWLLQTSLRLGLWDATWSQQCVATCQYRCCVLCTCCPRQTHGDETKQRWISATLRKIGLSLGFPMLRNTLSSMAVSASQSIASFVTGRARTNAKKANLH